MDIAIFKGGDLTAEAFSQDLAAFEQTKPRAASGAALMKMQKQDGVWVYGQDAIEVEQGSQWGIPAQSIAAGFIAWHGGKVEGERMATVGSTSIDPHSLGPVNAKNGWEEQVGFALICMTGEDKDVQVLFKSNTKGGIEAHDAVFDAVKARARAGLSFSPLVELTNTSYTHSEYGLIYKPVFEIVGWLGDEGDTTEQVEEGKPRRSKRKRPAA